jgi:3-oxoacyl-[acyl-carrier protein] reductase
MIDTGLEEKVVIVTGANNPYGIGAAISRAFAAQGARLLLHYFRSSLGAGSEGETGCDLPPGDAFYSAQQRRSAEEVVRSVRDIGGDALALEADLSDPAAVPRLFEHAEQAFGPVDVLINNAAYWEADTFVPYEGELANRLVELWTERPARISVESFDRMFAVNTRAVALMIAEFASRHVSRKRTSGRIINISTAGAYVFPSEISYGASKLALESYTRSAAAELAQFGITVNAVSPGPTQTGWITAELERQILSSIPMGRVGTPEDIADVVVFLASQQARWVTGQRIFVGGGHGM